MARLAGAQRAMAAAVLALAPLPAAGQSAPAERPPQGSTRIFDTEPGAAPGHRLLVSDLVLPADARGAAHYHPWEEFLYVIEGSAVVELPGAAPRIVGAGQSIVIPPRVVHTPRAGPQGVRAIVVRLHDLADPETLVPRP